MNDRSTPSPGYIVQQAVTVRRAAENARDFCLDRDPDVVDAMQHVADEAHRLEKWALEAERQ